MMSLVVSAVLLFGQVAVVPELAGRVVGVADGDTLTVLDAGNQQHRIRVSGIDAPETGQPFARRSKQALAEIVFGKDVVVEVEATDKYGRTIGRVLVDGDDAGLAMLNAGMAWHFDKYDATPEYAAAHAAARDAGTGLWSATDPIAPWQWRAMPKADRDRVREAVALDDTAPDDGTKTRPGFVWVEGYTRKDGVNVRGHWRKAK
jgi:endonuclease YncB( thermonuclease family)